jgi:hypothetical protein
MPADIVDLISIGQRSVDRLGRCAGNSTPMSTEQRPGEGHLSLQPSQPATLGPLVVEAEAEHEDVPLAIGAEP